MKGIIMQENKIKQIVKLISLAFIATPIVLTGCAPERKAEHERIHDVYASKAECLKEWKKEEYCKEGSTNSSVSGGGGYVRSGIAYFGPSYSGSYRSYNGITPKTNLSSHKYSNFSGFQPTAKFKAAPTDVKKVINHDGVNKMLRSGLNNSRYTFLNKSVSPRLTSANLTAKANATHVYKAGVKTGAFKGYSVSTSRGTSISSGRGGFGGRGGGGG